jgi:hypothetical protein
MNPEASQDETKAEKLYSLQTFLLHVFSSGATILEQSLHPAEKDVFQSHFFNVPTYIRSHEEMPFDRQIHIPSGAA